MPLVVEKAHAEDPPSRPRLNRARVVASAVELADQQGIEALSMRNLAQELGVVPMALYKHVTHKDELLDRMVEVVFDEVELPTGVDWKTALRARALSMRGALLRHPWAIAQMESRTAGPANLRHRDEMMRCLRDSAGLSVKSAVHVYSLADSYVYGFAFQQVAMTVARAATDAPAEFVTVGFAPADEYPHLNELLVEIERTGYDFDLEFEFGLDVLLDGIARLRGRRR